MHSRGTERGADDAHKKLEEQMAKFKAMPKSRDDEEKEWYFSHMEKAMAEIQMHNGTIGNILAAMVYQIAHQNRKEKPN